MTRAGCDISLILLPQIERDVGVTIDELIAHRSKDTVPRQSTGRYCEDDVVLRAGYALERLG